MATALIIAGGAVAFLGVIGGAARGGVDGAQALFFGISLGILLVGAGTGVFVLEALR